MLIGYARVSTLDQNLDMQVRALEAAGCEKVFAEKVTGTTADRPQYNKLKEFARDGHDTIVVYKLDRLGRSLRNLIDEMQLLHNRNIGFKSIQEHIDTTTSGGKLFFYIFAAIAEFERDIIKERTLSGLAAARARGRKGGRPPKLNASQIQMVKNLYNDKSNKLDDICEMFKISRITLYRTIRSN